MSVKRTVYVLSFPFPPTYHWVFVNRETALEKAWWCLNKHRKDNNLPFEDDESALRMFIWQGYEIEPGKFVSLSECELEEQ